MIIRLQPYIPPSLSMGPPFITQNTFDNYVPLCKKYLTSTNYDLYIS